MTNSSIPMSEYETYVEPPKGDTFLNAVNALLGIIAVGGVLLLCTYMCKGL